MGSSAYSSSTKFARSLLLVAYATMTALTPSFLMSTSQDAVDVSGEESGTVPRHQVQQLNRPGSLPSFNICKFAPLFVVTTLARNARDPGSIPGGGKF